MQRIVVIGGGFAGLWAAAAAARRLDELKSPSAAVRITLINRDPWHSIRVRNYEADLRDTRVPLADILDPIGVELVLGEVVEIDPVRQTIRLGSGANHDYDRLVVASGSALVMPAIEGLHQHAFHVDTFNGGDALNRHIAALGIRPSSAGRDTVLVIGAGLTGIEAACEMPGKLARAGIRDGRVILADALPTIGSDMGDEARPIIEGALRHLGIEMRTGIRVKAVDGQGATFADGKRIATETLVWSAGVRASPLAAMFAVGLDALNRLRVDAYMKVEGVATVFAAGDIATAVLDGVHTSVMSCQHGRPMGRYAGHNAVGDLLGLDMLPLRIERYVTCLDLGPWGALYTEGWDRRVTMAGEDAKRTKQTINRERIYPPRSRDRREILDAAAPIIQAPPLQAGTATIMPRHAIELDPRT
ncbi:MAG: NAD(P)/FAD-dependent oxidoreductase [Burkholderiales bacterium]